MHSTINIHVSQKNATEIIDLDFTVRANVGFVWHVINEILHLRLIAYIPGFMPVPHDR
jgi:hypothetical protein